MKKLVPFVIFPVLFFTLSCASGVEPGNVETNVIETAIQALTENSIPETSQGMLILKRYEYYLSELEKGNAYMDWREYSNPPVYNPTVFMRLMDQVIIGKIVTNTKNGRDAFYGITGFFERAYVSGVDGIIDSYIIYVPHTFNPDKNPAVHSST